jgi:hypothetical protein
MYSNFSGEKILKNCIVPVILPAYTAYKDGKDIVFQNTGI